MMTKKAKIRVIPIDKENAVIATTNEAADYAEATKVVKEIIEDLTGRNLETLTFNEMMKVRPVTLELTKVLADNKINLNNWDNHKEFLESTIKFVAEKLRSIHMLRVDLM